MIKKQKGFTIIELIVVIAIIAVLAGIVLVSVQGYQKKAKGTAFRVSVNEFIKAVNLKISSGEALPQITIRRTFPDVAGFWIDPGSTDRADFNTYFSKYISDFPKPAFDGAFFYYYNDSSPCAGSSYMLLVQDSFNSGLNASYFSDWTTYGVNKCYPLQ